MKIEEVKTGDAIAVVYGFNHLQARVLSNTGTHIVWSSFKWLKSSAVVSSYKEMEENDWTYLGVESPWWKFWSDITYKQV